jgi:arylsulfatase
MKLRTMVIVALALAVGALGCAQEEPDAVFLIVVDTLRPDRLSCYGEDRYQTPAIDALAAAGVRFDRAHSVASWTVPSMGAMLTSLYPTQLGLVEQPVPPHTKLTWRQRRQQRWHAIAHDETTLAELFDSAGYRTAAFVNQPGLNASDGFAQGIDDYFFPVSGDVVVRRGTEQLMEPKQWTPFLERAHRIDNRLVSRFDAWLSENAGEKLFVWVHLLTPHGPYEPPLWVTGRHPGLAEDGSNLKNTKLAYEGEVIAADSLVGQLLSSIDEHVGKKRSVVVFTSDHGEAFGEHGMIEHGHSLHGEVIHVPLIVRSSDTPAATAVARIVRTIDILPTILELAAAAIDPPAGLRGESLVPLFTGDGPHRLVYSEAMLYGSTERSLIVDGIKLMHDVQKTDDLLFDLIADGAELENVAAGRDTHTTSLRATLDSLYVELFEDFVRRAGSLPHSVEETEEIKRAMKALGYVGGNDE